MKLNLKFVSKIPKQGKDNEIIFLKQKNIKINILNLLIKSDIFKQTIFEQNFLKKDYNNKTYLFVNCTKSKISLDFEKLGSKLYYFLKDNKIENSFINNNNNSLNKLQLEKIYMG